jgi:hypothetical protein
LDDRVGCWKLVAGFGYQTRLRGWRLTRKPCGFGCDLPTSKVWGFISWIALTQATSKKKHLRNIPHGFPFFRMESINNINYNDIFPI